MKTLFNWYKKHKRDLPWRKTRNPYEIWVSEVLLQQTQVSRVIDYYERFLKRFPDLESLATASWRELLPVWRGLGYYSRGKNMLKTAKIVHREMSGKFPRTQQELKALPGIGEYTSAAILSFAWNKPVPAVDTNIGRILSRYYNCDPVESPQKWQQILSRSDFNSRNLNYALMDLGSLICKSRSPLCKECPFRTRCHYRKTQQNRKNNIKPVQKQKKRIQYQDIGIACIRQNGKYLIGLRKKNLWEFPGGKREPGESIRDCVKREVKEEIGIEVSVRPAFLKVEENGEIPIRLHFCRCQILRGKPKAKIHKKLQWITREEFDDFPFPDPNQAAFEKLKGMRS